MLKLKKGTILNRPISLILCSSGDLLELFQMRQPRWSAYLSIRSLRFIASTSSTAMPPDTAIRIIHVPMELMSPV